MPAIQLAEDPSALYSAAVTLSPVLLLTVVLVTRKALANWTGWQRRAWAVFFVGPAYLVMIPGVAGLASQNPQTWVTVVVLYALMAQIALSLASFWFALHDQSLTPN